MKKVSLILSVILIWGCSQAQEADVKEQATEAVKAEVAKAKDQAVEMAKDKVTERVDHIKSDAVDKVNEAIGSEVAKVAPKYQAGVHYSVINPAWDTKNEDQVVVYEFFGYLCPHCYSFQPYMKKLESQMPEHAKVERIPVVFRPQWKPFAQAYYTIENMGLVEELHNSLFEAIHQHRKPLRTIDDIADWAAAAHGVDKDEFLSTANSFMVDGLVRRGTQMMQAMGITSTPTLIVNGLFKPNNNALQTRDKLIDATTFLVDQVAEDMGLNK